MKKIKVLLLFFVALFAFSSADVYSQFELGDQPPCTDADTTSWGEPKAITVNIDGCWYVIEYYYRENMFGSHEFQITRTFLISGDSCIGKHSKKDINIAAYSKIFIDNEEGIANNETQYTVQEAACIEHDVATPENEISITESEDVGLALEGDLPVGSYTTNQDGTYTITAYEAFYGCASIVCCKMYYVLSRNAQGKIVSMEWSLPGGYYQPECDAPAVCDPNCDNLKFNWYAEGYEPEEKKAVLTNDNIVNISDNSSIIPNPNNGTFKLNYISDYAGEFTFTVYNINGEEISSQSFKKTIKEFSTSININGLINGTFIYVIAIDGIPDAKGIITINK